MSDQPSGSPDPPPSHDPPLASSSTSPQPTPPPSEPTSTTSPIVPPAAPLPAGGPVDGVPPADGATVADGPPPAGGPPPGLPQFVFQFVFPPPPQPGTPPAGGPPAGPPTAEARARFFERLTRMGFPGMGGQRSPGGRGAQSASPQPELNADIPPSAPVPAAEGGPAQDGLAGEDVDSFEQMIEREMDQAFGGGNRSPSDQAQHLPPPLDPDAASPSAGEPRADGPRPNVRPSNFPFAGLMPMGFNFPPPGGLLSQLAGLAPGQAPPPTGSPLATGDASAAPAGPPPPYAPSGYEGMPADMVNQMEAHFPGFAIFPSSPPAGGAHLPAGGRSPAPAPVSDAPAPAPAGGPPSPDVPADGQAEPQGPTSGLPSFLNLLASQIMAQMVQPPADPNAPPPDPNAPPQLPNGGAPIVITLHFGGPPPQEDKQPDPERAKELLSALDKPERSLVERLDRGLRLEEEEAGVELEERTGARCSVCLDSLLDADETGDGEEASKPKEKEKDDVTMADEDQNDMEVLSLPCSHAFHRACLGPWLEMHTNCPTCRFDLDPLSTTLRPNRVATTLPSRTSTPTPSTNGPSGSTTTSSNPSAATTVPSSTRGHPYSRPPTRPSTPQPTRPNSAAASAPSTPGSSAPAPLPADQRPYTPPPARLTLLSRVLSLESSHHLRCSLPLCTHAPSSTNPSGFPTSQKMFSLVRAEGELAPDMFGGEPKRWVLNGCEHVFHGDCLRIAEGVSFEGSVVGPDGAGVERDALGRRKVWCPVRGCQGEGWVREEDWEMEEEDEAEVEKAMLEREMGMEHQEEKAVLSAPAPMELDDTTASATDTTNSMSTHRTADEDTDGQ